MKTFEQFLRDDLARGIGHGWHAIRVDRGPDNALVCEVVSVGRRSVLVVEGDQARVLSETIPGVASE